MKKKKKLVLSKEQERIRSRNAMIIQAFKETAGAIGTRVQILSESKWEGEKLAPITIRSILRKANLIGRDY